MLDSKRTDVLLRLGQIYNDLNMFGQARAFVRAAQKADPDSEEASEFLATIETREQSRREQDS